MINKNKGIFIALIYGLINITLMWEQLTSRKIAEISLEIAKHSGNVVPFFL